MSEISGPWGIGVETDEDQAQIISSDGSEVAVVWIHPLMPVARLIVDAPDMYAYIHYVEDNMERIEEGGWTPIGFLEFLSSEERTTHAGGWERGV